MPPKSEFNSTLEKTIYETSNDVKWIKKELGLAFKAQSKTDSRVDKLESWKDKVNTAFVLGGVSVGGAWAKLLNLIK